MDAYDKRKFFELSVSKNCVFWAVDVKQLPFFEFPVITVENIIKANNIIWSGKSCISFSVCS